MQRARAVAPTTVLFIGPCPPPPPFQVFSKALVRACRAGGVLGRGLLMAGIAIANFTITGIAIAIADFTM